MENVSGSVSDWVSVGLGSVVSVVGDPSGVCELRVGVGSSTVGSSPSSPFVAAMAISAMIATRTTTASTTHSQGTERFRCGGGTGDVVVAGGGTGVTPDITWVAAGAAAAATVGAATPDGLRRAAAK